MNETKCSPDLFKRESLSPGLNFPSAAMMDFGVTCKWRDYNHDVIIGKKYFFMVNVNRFGALTSNSIRTRTRAIWVIDQVCSVKMAGYWPSSFFACLWTETESRSINTQKMNEANIQPS